MNINRSSYQLLAALALAATVALPACSQAAGVPVHEEKLMHASGKEALLPLIVALHFSGGSTAQAIADYSDLRSPVRIPAVRGAYPKRAGHSYFPLDYYAQSEQQQFAIARRTAADLAEWLGVLEKKYGVKPIVTGISQGGDLALLIAALHPSSVSASLPFAPVIPSMLAGELPALPARPPVHVFQGDADPIVLIGVTRSRVAALKDHMPVTLESFPGLGHDISPEMKASYTRLLDSLLQERGASRVQSKKMG